MCRRMEEVKRNEQRATVEDLMYASVLEKFVEVGVDMMPTLDSITESQETLKVQAACFPKTLLVSHCPHHCSSWVGALCQTVYKHLEGRVKAIVYDLLSRVCLPAVRAAVSCGWKEHSEIVTGCSR